MAGFRGDGFSIEFVWKETVHYWEGSRGLLLDASWGVKPPVLYVPAPEIWDACVPDWLRGRRAAVVGRLIAHSGHAVVDSPTEFQDGGRSRSLTRDA